MNIIFFGSSDYCHPIILNLADNFKLVGVVTRPDKPGGRKKSVTASSVKLLAQNLKIPVFTPKNKIDLMNLKNKIYQSQPDIAIVADYGLIIPREIFEIPAHKTLNIHFSRLPEFRGPSPVQYTILSGRKNSWISVIIMNARMDEGDIIWQLEVNLTGNETSGLLYQKLFNISAFYLPNLIKQYVQNELKPVSQDHKKASYTRLIKREDGFIPWEILQAAINGKYPPKKIISNWPLYKFITDKFSILHFTFLIWQASLAFSPWPGLWTELKITQVSDDPVTQFKKRLKILAAHLESKTEDRGLKTILVLDRVQLEGKNPVSWKQFLEGYPDVSSYDTPGVS